MERMVVTRHTTLERLSHFTNIVSLSLLLASGFIMYLGLPYLAYGDAYAIHVISAAVFVSVNWIVMPYSAFVNKTLPSYFFWPADLKRLWGAIKNFFTGSEYPPYTVYDAGKRRFVNRAHPLGKLLIYSHYAALLVATVTGVLLYSSSLSLLGVNLSGLILGLMDAASPSVGLSGMALARILHVAAAYWFVAEVVIHVGIVQLDPKKFPHLKSMFIDGKEDLFSDTTADIVDTSEGGGAFEEKTVIRIK
jgi:F420-nonreducing hydrogenase I cytochrome b subunit